MDQELGII